MTGSESGEFLITCAQILVACMNKISVCGINFKTASIDVRERCALGQDAKLALMRDIIRETTATQAVVLVTCNRTEIYADTAQTKLILNLLHQHSGIDTEVLQNVYYENHGQMAVEHLMRVAAGMDSMVVGETEIFGQVKQAFQLSKEQGYLGPLFLQLIDIVNRVAKSVRSSTQMGMCPVSVASIACKEMQALIESPASAAVLLVGSGETTKLLAQYVKRYAFRSVTIAARNQEAAAEIAAICGASILPLSALHEALSSADVVMSATASQVPIIGKGAVESALQKREMKPIVLIDMAVPRDIEPEVSELESIHLISVDDLRDSAQENISTREHALAKVETLIVREAEKFIRQLHGEDTGPLLKALYAKAGQLRESELKKCRQMLAAGADLDEVLDYLSRSITSKLLHEPSLLMRYADKVDHPEFRSFIEALFKH